jgi:hypothetical protein
MRKASVITISPSSVAVVVVVEEVISVREVKEA